MRPPVLIFVAAALAALVAAPPGGSELRSGFTLSSPAFRSGGTIPRLYTCDGANISPALRWKAPPAGARSFALIMDDPDAPDGGPFTHWLAWGLSAKSRTLAARARPPAEGRNDHGRRGWFGPCPPPGKPHRYVFRLYALNSPLP